eukprot:886531-Amphidinium_carterae.1
MVAALHMPKRKYPPGFLTPLVPASKPKAKQNVAVGGAGASPVDSSGPSSARLGSRGEIRTQSHSSHSDLRRSDETVIRRSTRGTLPTDLSEDIILSAVNGLVTDFYAPTSRLTQTSLAKTWLR